MREGWAPTNPASHSDGEVNNDKAMPVSQAAPSTKMLRGANWVRDIATSATMLIQKARTSANASDSPFGRIWYL